MSPAALAGGPQARFGCFILLATAADGRRGAGGVAVVLEDLASGEKRRFATPGALVEFLEAWGRKATAPASSA